MVDAVGPSGQVSSVTSKQQQKATSVEQPKPKEGAAFADAVTISQEALILADIEAATQNVSQELAQDTSATLSSDVSKLNALL